MRVSIMVGHNVGNVPTFNDDEIVAEAMDILALQGATCYGTIGVWRGNTEESTRIDVICSLREARRIKAAAPALARALNQDAVLVSIMPSFASFVGPAKSTD